MWLVLVLLATFIPVHTLSVLYLGPEDLLFEVESEISWFSFLLKVIICDDFLQGIIETTSINSLPFIFTIPVHFIYSTIKVSKYYFVVISLVLFLLLSLAISFLVLYTENSVISLNISDTFKAQMKQDKQSCEKKVRERCSPTNCFLYGVFDHGWYDFQLKYWCFHFLFIFFFVVVIFK